MRVGIVGAGLAGLAAARDLRAAGHQSFIFEKSSQVGGRVETVRAGGYAFDSGATSVAPRGLAIETVLLRELPQEDLVEVVKPIYVHRSLRVGQGDPERNLTARYVYRGGLDRLPILLAKGLDVRLGVAVEAIDGSNGAYRLSGETFDAVILTPPLPQSSTLLWTQGETRAFANAPYRSCLAVMLGFARELPPQHYHALVDAEQGHPMGWLSIETEKCPDRAPAGHTAFVMQFNGAYSKAHFDNGEPPLIDLALEYLDRLYGPGWDSPEVSAVRRWKYSQPEGLASFEAVNRGHSRLLVASDGLTGGRTEQAYEAGVRAARLLIAGG